MSESLGVYVRKGDMWHLENVTNEEAARLAKDVNQRLGLDTLIVDSCNHFPEWLES